MVFNITFRANDSGGSGITPTKIIVTPPNERNNSSVDWPAGSLPVTDGGSGEGFKMGPVSKLSDSPAG